MNNYYKNKFTRFFFYMVNTPIFNGLIIFIILLNTIVLAIQEKYPAWDESVLAVLNQTNVIFTIVFTVEVVFKLLGLGVGGYVQDKFNIFDCIIVLVSLVDLIMAHFG